MAEADVIANYSSDAIVERILAAVAANGATGPLTAEMLFPYDQLHGRELAATREHIPRLGVQPSWRVLDIGSGIGGPARFIASTTGAHVMGIDLTPALVQTATELSGRVGLDALVQFEQGNAEAMPFEDRSFDAAICFYVGMNLPNKPAVLAEAHRVLKPGAKLLWTQVVSGSGDPIYPLPWAVSAAVSHVVSPEQLRQAMVDAGFAILDWADETNAHVELAKAGAATGMVPTQEHLSVLHVVLGEGFAERRMNYIRNLTSGAMRSVAVLARA
ncbi:MAG TPA: methyltransferase domain-containing protein [Devosia sp.]|nr:methyltransferase domain-containing protein [Devosia sp.]